MRRTHASLFVVVLLAAACPSEDAPAVAPPEAPALAPAAASPAPAASPAGAEAAPEQKTQPVGIDDTLAAKLKGEWTAVVKNDGKWVVPASCSGQPPSFSLAAGDDPRELVFAGGQDATVAKLVGLRAAGEDGVELVIGAAESGEHGEERLRLRFGADDTLVWPRESHAGEGALMMRVDKTKALPRWYSPEEKADCDAMKAEASGG